MDWNKKEGICTTKKGDFQASFSLASSLGSCSVSVVVILVEKKRIELPVSISSPTHSGCIRRVEKELKKWVGERLRKIERELGVMKGIQSGMEDRGGDILSSLVDVVRIESVGGCGGNRVGEKKKKRKAVLQKTPRTNREKYVYLLKINPLLKEFQKRFSLFPS